MDKCALIHENQKLSYPSTENSLSLAESATKLIPLVQSKYGIGWLLTHSHCSRRGRRRQRGHGGRGVWKLDKGKDLEATEEVMETEVAQNMYARKCKHTVIFICIVCFSGTIHVTFIPHLFCSDDEILWKGVDREVHVESFRGPIGPAVPVPTTLLETFPLLFTSAFCKHDCGAD